jgi:hypothetical protein
MNSVFETPTSSASIIRGWVDLSNEALEDGDRRIVRFLIRGKTVQDVFALGRDPDLIHRGAGLIKQETTNDFYRAVATEPPMVVLSDSKGKPVNPVISSDSEDVYAVASISYMDIEE